MITIFLSASLILIACFYVYRKWFCFQLFKRLEIPGPKPNFLFGNSLDLWVDDRHAVLQRWTKKYGKIFGYYDGPRAILVISDLHMVEQVCTKQTSCFEGRQFAPVQPDSELEPNNPLLSMMISKKAQWHRPRIAASPFFSPAKLQHLVPAIEQKSIRLLQLLDSVVTEKGEEAFDVRELFQRYAMDVICDTAFGLSLHLLENEHKEHNAGMKIYDTAREMVHNGVVKSPSVFLAVNTLMELKPIASFFVHFVMKFSSGPLSPLHGLLQLVGTSIVNRFHNNNSNKSTGDDDKNDLLQMLCDITKLPEESSRQNSISKCPFARFQQQYQPPKQTNKRFLNEGQLKTNVVMFLMAGYETSSTTLSYISHTLAMHQDVQEKLYNEIVSFYPDPDQPMDYDTVMNQMHYLDWVCLETIRIYPEGVNIINRFVTEETVLRGYRIPKNVGSILVDVWSIHNDYDLWGPVDPAEFYPERFSPDYPTSNRPRSAYLGFGIGPHRCIGMNYALLEIKLTLIRLIRCYKLMPSSCDAPKRIPVKVMLVMVPTGDVVLKLIHR